MNTIKTIDTEYLRANRTVETIIIYNGKLSKTLWIYNFEGVHFRIFQTLSDVFTFFNNKNEADYSFDTESELDYFLLNFHLK